MAFYNTEGVEFPKVRINPLKLVWIPSHILKKKLDNLKKAFTSFNEACELNFFFFVFSTFKKWNYSGQCQCWSWTGALQESEEKNDEFTSEEERK